jgi:hypothetical protein
MAKNTTELFDQATAEIHALGDEITQRKSTEAGGNSLTAEMRAGMECLGKEARGLSLNMLAATLNAAQDSALHLEHNGRNGLDIRAGADKMIQALADSESATR